MARNDVLDPREAKFVSLYVENPNGTNAAIAAGFGNTPGSSAVYATTLLKKPKIQAAIAKQQAKFLQRYEATPDRLIREFSRIAFGNVENFIAIQDDGSVVIDFATATRDELAALASIESEEELRDDGAARVRKTKFKHYDKLKALTELAKLARMYPAERTELTGADGGPIQSASLVAHKIDIASLEPEQRDQLRSVLLALKAKSEDEAT